MGLYNINNLNPNDPLIKQIMSIYSQEHIFYSPPRPPLDLAQMGGLALCAYKGKFAWEYLAANQDRWEVPANLKDCRNKLADFYEELRNEEDKAIADDSLYVDDEIFNLAYEGFRGENPCPVWSKATERYSPDSFWGEYHNGRDWRNDMVIQKKDTTAWNFIHGLMMNELRLRYGRKEFSKKIYDYPDAGYIQAQSKEDREKLLRDFPEIKDNYDLKEGLDLNVDYKILESDPEDYSRRVLVDLPSWDMAQKEEAFVDIRKVTDENYKKWPQHKRKFKIKGSFSKIGHKNCQLNRYISLTPVFTGLDPGIGVIKNIQPYNNEDGFYFIPSIPPIMEQLHLYEGINGYKFMSGKYRKYFFERSDELYDIVLDKYINKIFPEDLIIDLREYVEDKIKKIKDWDEVPTIIPDLVDKWAQDPWKYTSWGLPDGKMGESLRPKISVEVEDSWTPEELRSK